MSKISCRCVARFAKLRNGSPRRKNNVVRFKRPARNRTIVQRQTSKVSQNFRKSWTFSFRRYCGDKQKSVKEDRPILPSKHPVGYVGSLTHNCALKEALSSQVYPRAFLTSRHARIEKEIPDKPNSGLARIRIPLVPYLIGTAISHRYTYVHPRRVSLWCGPARVRFNSSAKLSLFPPEASFTEYPIFLVHSDAYSFLQFFVVTHHSWIRDIRYRMHMLDCLKCYERIAVTKIQQRYV